MSKIVLIKSVFMFYESYSYIFSYHSFFRNIADPAISGWSFYLQYERSCRLDLCGSDPVLDLISIIEQPPGFPCSFAGSVISLDKSNPMPFEQRDTVVE